MLFRFLGVFVMVISIDQLINAQNFTIILGRPTDQSISANIVFDNSVDYKVNYGLQADILNQTIGMFQAKATIPNVVEFTGLQSDTRYYYRLSYKLPSSGNFLNSEIYTFHTQRTHGKEFTFTVEADEHLYDKKGYRPLYEICLSNQAKDKPDFMISLGDTFGDDHTPDETTSMDMKELHEEYLQYLTKLCHSVPFFFCLGNHEGENGYYLKQDNGENIAVYGTQWRKYYYPNPYPNHFYSGNMAKEDYGIELPENYYAFTWGDALFVILDVYRHCDINEKPQKWDWTLGEEQYKWFRKTLEESNSKYKFVFAHHTRGQGRGGKVTADGYEWGGYNNNTYQFDENRPGWGKPIHKVMEDEGVNIFFQGHDHLFAWEKVGNMIYQEVPMPSDSSYKIGVTENGDAYSDVKLDGSGHLRLNVKPECVTIDYIRAYLPKDTINAAHKNGEIAFTYTIGDCTSNINESFSSEELTIYPNPTSNVINLKTNQSSLGDKNIEIVDLFGKIVYKEKFSGRNNPIEINISLLSKGIYLLKYSEELNKMTYKKICIQ